jgi:hypothetical protein
MIGGIKTGSLEDNANRKEHFPQAVFPTLGTFFNKGFVEVLLAIELDPAVFTTVRVNRHKPPWNTENYSPRVGGLQE